MLQKNREAFLSGAAAGIYLSIVYIAPFEKVISLSELVLQLSGSRGSFSLGCSLTELIEFMLRMLPNYIVMLVWGSQLYRYFCTASIYVFSRTPKRLEWYKRTLVPLLGNVCVFKLTLMAAAIFTAMLRYQVIFTPGGLILLVCHLAIYILWLFGWILLINLCAMKIGSSSAFATTAGIQMACTAGLGIVKTLEKLQFSNNTIERFVAYNPVARTVLGWHRSDLLLTELSGNRYSLSLSSTVILLLLFCMAVVVVGGYLIQKQDIIVEDIEVGTI